MNYHLINTRITWLTVQNHFQKSIVILGTVIAIWVPITHGDVTQNTQYTTKYDNVDINDIIHNDRLLKGYVNCLLDKGPCTADGLELKSMFFRVISFGILTKNNQFVLLPENMPDAIETNCSKCSDKQREGSEVMMQYLIDNKPEYWNPLQEKYDPTGSYRKRYLDSKKAEVGVEPVKSDE